jgi:hypothetical protein
VARVAVKFDGASGGARRAAAETRAAVKSVGDQADRDTKRISLLGPALRGTLQLATLGLTAFAGASLIAFKKSTDAASNLEEQINKARVVFRGAEEEVIAWSRTTATSIGISQRAALEFAGTFGNMLVPMGFARDEAAKMSMQLVQLAADMASFNNASPEETLEALRAGLAGETEPLRRFGIFLNDARIKQEALNAGLIKGKEELTAAGKAAAIYRIILKDTADAQGDVERTSSSWANTKRRLAAQVEDVAAKIGRLFLPAVESAGNAVSAWLGDEENQRRLEEWAETLVDGVGAALEGIADWVRAHEDDLVEFFRESGEFAEDAARLIGDVAAAADDVAEAVGGWDEVFKFAAIIASVNALLGVAGSGGKAGTGLVGIVAMLNRLKLIGPISVVVAIDYVTDGAVRDIVGDVAGAGGTQTGAGSNPYRDTSGVWRSRVDNKPVADQAHWERKFRAGEINAQGSYKTGGSAGQHPDGRASGTAYTQQGTEFQQGLVATGRQLGPGSGEVYVWGGESIEEGYDCSGYLYDVYRRNGVTIPRDTRSQWNDPNAIKVPKGSEQPGDGVYFAGSRTGANAGPPPGHVGLYIGNGRFIEYFSKGKPARINTLSGRRDYMGARRWMKIKSGGGSGGGGGRTDYTPEETTADTGVEDTGSGGGGRSRATIDSRDLASARGSARFINTHLDSIANPTLRARIRERAAAIVRALGDVTDPKEFNRIKRNLAALERDFENGVKLTAATNQAKKTAASISAQLSRMPDSLQAELRPKLEKLQAALGNVTSQKQLDSINAGLEKIRERIRAGVEKMIEAVEQRRDAFAAAFGKVADKALDVFDAKTDELIRNARTKVGDLELREGDEGPAARRLREFREQREADERARRRKELEDRVNELSVAKAEETEEEKNQRLRDLADAREAIRQDDLANEERRLEAEAAAEQKAIDDGLARERARISGERDVLRDRFQERLGAIITAFENEEITADEAQRRLLALLADPQYQTDFANVGRLLGDAFAGAFNDALRQVAAAVDALRDAVNELRRATGQDPIGGSASAVLNQRQLEERARRQATAGGGGGGRYVPMQHGGRVPGRYVGREDTVMLRATPGEYVLDRRLTGKLEQLTDGDFIGLLRRIADGQDRVVEGQRRILRRPVDLTMQFPGPPAEDPHAYAQRARQAIEAHLG